MNLTADIISKLLVGVKDPQGWAVVLNEQLPKYDIDTVERLAHFFSQTGHESANYNVLEENLNYSATGLNKVFPKYFKNAGRDANHYARKPAAIANIVYANRLGNGDTNSGDGWKYRGRGIIQLTGKDNYTKFGLSLTPAMSPDQVVEYLKTKEGAVKAALWYWNSRKINAVADTGSVEAVTKLINGGTAGLEERKNRYENAKKVLASVNLDDAAVADVVAAEPVVEGKTYDVGDRDPVIRQIQEKLNMPISGVYGPITKNVVMRFQEKNKLPVTGIADPVTVLKILNS